MPVGMPSATPIAGRGADREADADLARAADNGVGEEAVDADEREQRRQGGNRGRERRAHAFVERVSLQPFVEGRDPVRVFAAQALSSGPSWSRSASGASVDVC